MNWERLASVARKWNLLPQTKPDALGVDYSREPRGLRQLQQTADTALCAANKAMQAAIRLEELVNSIKRDEVVKKRRTPVRGVSEPENLELSADSAA